MWSSLEIVKSTFFLKVMCKEYEVALLNDLHIGVGSVSNGRERNMATCMSKDCV